MTDPASLARSSEPSAALVAPLATVTPLDNSRCSVCQKPTLRADLRDTITSTGPSGEVGFFRLRDVCPTCLDVMLDD